MAKLYTRAQIIDEIQRFVDKVGKTAAAKTIGVSQVQLMSVLKWLRPPRGKILEHFGYVEAERYQKGNP